MKKLTLVYILILLFAVWLGLKITDTPGYNTPSGSYKIGIDEPASYNGIIKGINTSGFNIGDSLFIDGHIDSTAWIPIDTVFGDTILNIINSNHYRWYKVEFAGSGGPMVIHGAWVNPKDSTITEFTLTE